jgi:hypothetical protein
MKKMVAIFWVMMMGVIFAAISGSPAKASGELSTMTATSPGQILVRNQDGTMYLTTQVVEGETVVSTQNTQNTTNNPLAIFILPEGFSNNFGSLVNSLMSIIMVVSALLVFFYLIWGGFDWITSGGDKAKTDKARQKITAAIVGLIIVSASYAILSLVVNFLGYENLNDLLKNARTIY